MPNDTPRVTIGMPVYNGAATVCATLESLLAQTFADFEIVISDNASTDSTRDVLAGYAARDSRVRVVRQAENIGANPNYNFVARQARSPYFKWASSNDLCAPAFLERCVEVLDARPDVVLAFPRTKLFSDTPESAEDYPHDFALDGDSAADRFQRFASSIRLNNVFNGVVRTAALHRTGLMGRHYGSDIVVMAHLALLGKFVQVPEPLYFRRMDPAYSTRMKSAEQVQQHHYPRVDARTLFQAWRLHADWFRTVIVAPISMLEKRRALACVARMSYYRWRDLADDIAEAARYAVGRTAP